MTGILTEFLEQQRLDHVLPYLQGSVLDLGCGYAPILKRLPDSAVYMGVDGYAPAIRALQERYPLRTFLLRDLDNDPLAITQRFDTILMMAVIEHLNEPGFVLAQIPALLKPGGRLLITTPTPLGNMLHHAGAKIGLFSQEAADDHKFIFNRRTITALFATCGLVLNEYRLFLLGQNQFCLARVPQAA